LKLADNKFFSVNDFFLTLQMVLLLLMLSSLFQTNKERLISNKKGDKESKEPDYDDDKDHLEEKLEKGTGESI
jgi:hypothetical protein